MDCARPLIRWKKIKQIEAYTIYLQCQKKICTEMLSILYYLIKIYQPRIRTLNVEWWTLLLLYSFIETNCERLKITMNMSILT